MRVWRYIQFLRESEARLADAFDALAEDHVGEPDVRSTALLLASWSHQHVQTLNETARRYAPKKPLEAVLPESRPEGPHDGGRDLLLDLHEVWLLGQEVHLCWTVLGQVARALRDGRLVTMAAELGSETDRQLAWLHTRIVEAAPQALVVGSVEPALR